MGSALQRELRGRTMAEAEDAAAEGADCGRNARVVEVQHGGRAGREPARERELLALDRLDAAELGDVREANVEHHADLGLTDVAEVGDLPGLSIPISSTETS